MTTATNTKKIPLTQGQFAIVDACDFDKLNQHKWYALKYKDTFYAKRNSKYINGKRKAIRMHREIMGLKNKHVVDHINHDGLDNRRRNLRLCSRQQNNMNRSKAHGLSKYKGVSFHKNNMKWRAGITVSNKIINLGYFRSEKDAAIAYDEAAISLFKAFACLNQTLFPDDFKPTDQVEVAQ